MVAVSELNWTQESEVLSLIGSKEDIFHLPTAFVDPGTIVLVPDPGYPTYRNAVRLVGGELYAMPLDEERAWLPDLEAIPAGVPSRAGDVANYPNNPTTAVSSLLFPEEGGRIRPYPRRHPAGLRQSLRRHHLGWVRGAQRLAGAGRDGRGGGV